MATSAAQVDDVWAQRPVDTKAHSYMQSDVAFRALSVPSRRAKPVAPVRINVLGVEINWTPDGREFPPVILDAINRLYAMASLDEGWDSYAGKSLDRALVAGALRLVFHAHHSGRGCPRLVPLSSGGIGLRWETETKELDLDLRPGGGHEITLEDLLSGEVTEQTVSTIEEAERLVDAAL